MEKPHTNRTSVKSAERKVERIEKNTDCGARQGI